MKYRTLAEARPDIALDWSEENELSPDEVAHHSATVVEWKCHKCGREWRSTVNTRSSRPVGYGCKNCSKAIQKVTHQNTLERKRKLQGKPTLNCEIVHILFEKYEGRTDVLLKCPDCGNQWHGEVLESKVDNVCPFCSSNIGNDD